MVRCEGCGEGEVWIGEGQGKRTAVVGVVGCRVGRLMDDARHGVGEWRERGLWIRVAGDGIVGGVGEEGIVGGGSVGGGGNARVGSVGAGGWDIRAGGVGTQRHAVAVIY